MTNFLSAPITARDHIAGSLRAPVVLVEYGDYQCPYCGAAYSIVKEMQRRFGNDLCFVFRNFPLIQVHENALRAAVTAEWAAQRGRYWEMHDYLYEHQDELDARSLLDAAQQLGLDRPHISHSCTGAHLHISHPCMGVPALIYLTPFRVHACLYPTPVRVPASSRG